jgi:ABC-type polysaccharide/polyol phosphate export permease
MLTWRDISIKYRQSVMGFFWALLMPLLIVGAGVLVRVGLASVSGKPVVPSQITTVALKALPWSFFVASLRFATSSLAANANLVTRIAFPRAVFPVSAVLSQLFDFAVASPVVLVLLAAASVRPGARVLWVPVLLGLLLLLTTGLALLLSAANLFFRDVKYLVEIVLTFAIFFTPVFYDVEMFGARGAWLMLNPIAPILEGLRSSVIEDRTPVLGWTLYSAFVALALGGIAPVVFRRLEPKFAERI